MSRLYTYDQASDWFPAASLQLSFALISQKKHPRVEQGAKGSRGQPRKRLKLTSFTASIIPLHMLQKWMEAFVATKRVKTHSYSSLARINSSKQSRSDEALRRDPIRRQLSADRLEVFCLMEFVAPAKLSGKKANEECWPR